MISEERIQAAINLLYPDDMTPNAKRVLESILEEPGGTECLESQEEDAS